MTRRPVHHPDQMAFVFAIPEPARAPAALAGIDRAVSAVVARALKEDRRSREEIAGAMSALLTEDVSRWMLDAYASEARETHSISAGRLLALVAVTDRFDLLDALTAKVGARVLVGEEIHTARLGHLRAQMKALQAELAAAERQALPIDRKGALK